MPTTAKELLDCTVHRRLNGLEFEIKAPKIEEVMRLISGGRTRNSNDSGVTWEGAQFYRVDIGGNGIPAAFAGFSAGRFDLWGSRELLLSRDPKINLSMLLAVGLTEGVKITIPTVISTKQLNQFTDGFTSAVRQFYIDFLKDSSVHIRITTEEIQD